MNQLNIGNGLPISEAFALSLFDSIWQGALIVLCVWCMRYLFRDHVRMQYLFSVAGLVFLFTCSVYHFIELSVGGVVALSWYPIGGIFPYRNGLYEWFNIIWLIGSGLFLLRFLFSHIFLKKLIYRAQTIHDEMWRSSYEKIKAHFHVNKEVLLLHSDSINTAFITGVLRPVILIPSSWISGLGIKEIECILSHEIAHIRSKDHWINFFAQIAEIIYFFNPAVHILNSHIKLDRELQADQSACRYTGAPLFYAKLLLQVEESRVQLPSGTLPFFSQKRQLHKRVEGVLQLRRLHRPQHLALVSMILLAGFLFFEKHPTVRTTSSVSVVNSSHTQELTACIPETEPFIKKLKTQTIIYREKIKKKISSPEIRTRYTVKRIHINPSSEELEGFANVELDRMQLPSEDMDADVRKNLVLVLAGSKLNTDSADLRHLGSNLILSITPRCYAPSETKVFILNSNVDSKDLKIEVESLEPGVWIDQHTENIP